ncbi:hypothetical protein Hanom_Chr09g00852631 [Helianthus anomalus]
MRDAFVTNVKEPFFFSVTHPNPLRLFFSTHPNPFALFFLNQPIITPLRIIADPK